LIPTSKTWDVPKFPMQLPEQHGITGNPYFDERSGR
jgi:hypothetical protein